MHYIIGLGNTGASYQNTQHNIAWIIFDSEKALEWKSEKLLPGELGVFEGDLYIKPSTFVNNSGKVLPFLKKKGLSHYEDLVVVHDDIDLPFGKIKISYGHGDGGHNGIKSFIQHAKTKNFIRIRVGVAVEKNGVFYKPNVLAPFDKKALEEISTVLAPRVFAIIKSLGTEGLEKTMNIFNTK